MPKMPGRESTRIKVPIDMIEVGSFVGAWEHYAQGKICCVEGCDHVVSGRRATEQEVRASDTDVWWVHCDDVNVGVGAATVYDKREPENKRGHRGLLICPCCLAKIDESWRAAHGDPE